MILPNNSARIQPNDQISMAWVYSVEDKSTSGALYHL